MNPVLALLRLPRKNASLQILFKCPTPAIVFRNATKTLTSCSHLTRCTIPCACHAKRDLNVQKWSVHGVLWAFWLRNVLRATMACTFSTSQLSKVLRTWGVFCFFTCKCASRHNGVHFFISHLARWLRTRCFSEPTFRPSGATNHWKKTQCFATFLPFRAPASFFFWLFLFSDLPSPALLSSTLLLFSLTLSISAFHLSILSEVWLLNFLRQIDYFKSLFPQGLYFWPNKNHPEVHHFVRLQDLLQICCDEGWAGLRHWNYGLDTGVTMKIHGIETWKHGKWSWI